jgi:hypothetical protein
MRRRFISCRIIITSALSQVGGHRKSGQGSAQTGSAAHALDVKVGLSLFFRILRSLKHGNNVLGLMRVARQLPQLLAAMPPLALFGDAGEPITSGGAWTMVT